MREFDRGGPLHCALLRYAQAQFTQLAQAAACYIRCAKSRQTPTRAISVSTAEVLEFDAGPTGNSGSDRCSP